MIKGVGTASFLGTSTKYRTGSSFSVTGASVGAGRTLKVTADLADALIDAGYEIRIDAAAEDMRDSPSEVRIPLSTANVGKPQSGKQYIQSVTFELK